MYEFSGERMGLLQGVSLTLNANNVFDRDPPVVYNLATIGFGYDSSNASITGRELSLSIRKSW